MNPINDKISLIIDVNSLLKLDDPEVQYMISGDTYRIIELYNKNLQIFRDNLNIQFVHVLTNEIKTLKEWMNWYKCDSANYKDVMNFLRYAVLSLKHNY